jgi:hypothetical protein
VGLGTRSGIHHLTPTLSATGGGEGVKTRAGRWLAALAVYRRPRLTAILLMGFSSGLPLALTGATLSFWLAKTGVSLATIGFFSLVGFSYSLKFLWSPLIDRLPIPAAAGGGDPDAWPDRPAGRSGCNGAGRGRRRLPVGQPGHCDRRLSH